MTSEKPVEKTRSQKLIERPETSQALREKIKLLADTLKQINRDKNTKLKLTEKQYESLISIPVRDLAIDPDLMEAPLSPETAYLRVDSMIEFLNRVTPAKKSAVADAIGDPANERSLFHIFSHILSRYKPSTKTNISTDPFWACILPHARARCNVYDYKIILAFMKAVEHHKKKHASATQKEHGVTYADPRGGHWMPLLEAFADVPKYPVGEVCSSFSGNDAAGKNEVVFLQREIVTEAIQQVIDITLSLGGAFEFQHEHADNAVPRKYIVVKQDSPFGEFYAHIASTQAVIAKILAEEAKKEAEREAAQEAADAAAGKKTNKKKKKNATPVDSFETNVKFGDSKTLWQHFDNDEEICKQIGTFTDKRYMIRRQALHTSLEKRIRNIHGLLKGKRQSDQPSTASQDAIDFSQLFFVSGKQNSAQKIWRNVQLDMPVEEWKKVSTGKGASVPLSLAVQNRALEVLKINAILKILYLYSVAKQSFVEPAKYVAEWLATKNAAFIRA